MNAELFLPWPGNKLSPNSRLHWAVKSKAVKAYRNACGWQVRAEGIGTINADAMHVKMTFFPPDNRHYDLDGLISRMKAGLDGISDVVGINDRDFTLTPIMAAPLGKEGMVKIELEWKDRSHA